MSKRGKLFLFVRMHMVTQEDLINLAENLRESVGMIGGWKFWRAKDEICTNAEKGSDQILTPLSGTSFLFIVGEM